MAKIELLDEQPLNITMSEPQTINETITPQENINVETTDGWYEKSYTETDPVYSRSPASTITEQDIESWDNKSDFSGDYNDLENKPIIPEVPTKTSDLVNDSGFSKIYYVSKEQNDYTKNQIVGLLNEGYEIHLKYNDNYLGNIKPIFVLSGYNDNYMYFTDVASTTVITHTYNFTTNTWSRSADYLVTDDIYDEIPTKTSDLTNDSGFLTEHQDISGKVDKENGKGLSTNDFTDTYKSNVDSNTAARHTHSNKSVLDDISSSDVSNWDSKQETLVSGTNIKTINNESILGSGNITIQGGGTGNGDMLKSVYDTNDNGIVDNAEKVNNHTVEKDVPSNAVFTDTTYESKTASSGGTDVSLVTTGEKYTWNNKSDFSGSYNDLSNKPTIPSEVTETTVSNWGFTKNTGTYSKPSGGIPKTDLASAVQTSLGKADTALQSYTETDPVFSASASSSITSSDITSWNSKSEFSGSYTDLTDKPTIPDELSDLSDDSTHRLVTDTEKSTWNAKSDFSGSYTDLSNKPTIPSKTSDLTNDSGYTTFSGDYDDLTNKPTIPTKTSDLTNDSGFIDNSYHDSTKQDTITSSNKLDYSLLDNTPTIPTVPTALSSFTDDLGSSPTHTHSQYLTSHQDISGKVDKETGKGLSSNDFTTTYKSNVDSNTSARHTHSNKTVLDGISSSDITNWNNKSTFSGDYDDLTNKPTIPTKTSDITNDSNFITATNYASNQTGGTIKTDTSTYGTSMYSGYLTGSTRTYEQYNNAANALFVSKGTLENVITGKQLASTSAIPTKVSDLTNDSGFITNSYHDSSKQDSLVSGNNIKTINNTSLLGSGDISFETIQEISGESSISIKNLATGIYRIYGGDYGCDIYYNSTGSLSVPSMAYAYLIVTVFPDIYTVNSWTFMGNSSEFYYGYCWGSHGYCYSVTSAEAQETITGILSNLTTTSKTNLVSAINELDSDKQDTLVSGTNIKTVNNNSLLGSGNINIVPSRTIIQATQQGDVADYNANYAYFSPFAGNTTVTEDCNIGSGLTFGKKTVSYGDRTSNSVYGFTIGSGISLIKVCFSVRYLCNHTSQFAISSLVYRDRNGTSDLVYGISDSTPASSRCCQTGTVYIPVQQGDFIFFGSWRSVKAADVDVIAGNNSTNMSVEVIN